MKALVSFLPEPSFGQPVQVVQTLEGRIPDEEVCLHIPDNPLVLPFCAGAIRPASLRFEAVMGGQIQEPGMKDRGSGTLKGSSAARGVPQAAGEEPPEGREA